jgi:hypothetical protein
MKEGLKQQKILLEETLVQYQEMLTVQNEFIESIGATKRYKQFLEEKKRGYLDIKLLETDESLNVPSMMYGYMNIDEYIKHLEIPDNVAGIVKHDILLNAIRKQQCSLAGVSEENRTVELCIEAIEKDSLEWDYVPIHIKDEVSDGVLKNQSENKNPDNVVKESQEEKGVAEIIKDVKNNILRK